MCVYFTRRGFDQKVGKTSRCPIADEREEVVRKMMYWYDARHGLPLRHSNDLSSSRGSLLNIVFRYTELGR